MKKHWKVLLVLIIIIVVSGGAQLLNVKEIMCGKPDIDVRNAH